MKIIAELCQNHNGDQDLMLRMVEAAAKAGATHVKIQHIFAKNLSFRSQFETGYFDEKGSVRCIKRPYDLEYQRLRKLELDDSSVSRFIQECSNQGVIPMTTCFAREHVLTLKDFGFENIKVASYDCASFQLLKELSVHKWSIFISTGATYDAEIKKAAECMEGREFDFLHCITIYPTPLNQLNLRRINYLNRFTSSVGFSDHTKVKDTGIKASIGAIQAGAKIIERHFTLLGPDETKDGPVSVSPSQLKEIVNFSKMDDESRKSYIETSVPEFKSMLGNETRQLTDEELLNRDYYRGRFASVNKEKNSSSAMIFNWEEVGLE